MSEPVLAIGGLTYRYPGNGTQALAEVSLEVAAGEFVVLAGRSGSGKSTLLRAACGLVPHFFGGEVSGSILVGGMDVREHGPAELAGVVGMVGQDPEAQVVSATVLAEVELPLELRGWRSAERARAVEEVALALALDGLLERTTDTLSGGELQRVAIAAALVTRPRLLLLDEPTSQLDPVAGDELIGVLRRVNEELGVTVILGEHRLERCLGACDRVVTLSDGRVASDGAPRGFLRWALDHDTALATPAAKLMDAAGLEPEPTVRETRRALSLAGRITESPVAGRAGPGRGEAVSAQGTPPGPPALELRGVEVKLDAGEAPVTALAGVELAIAPGERVVLMGRNGAGKSTLLNAAAGVLDPDRGQVVAPRGAALLPQRPGDMLVRDRVADELPGEPGLEALRVVGLEDRLESDPRDLSGGERQRLALAIAFAGRGAGSGRPPGAVLMDEPTRGMDRARKAELIGLLDELAASGSALLVATHDVEFAAGFAERVVLLGRGRVLADGPAREMLAGGWYFSTEVARILDGAALTAAGGAGLLGAGEQPGVLS